MKNKYYYEGFNIGVIALLNPSQIEYKITPMLLCGSINRVVLFRKVKYGNNNDKLVQYILPSLFKFKIVYWIYTPFYVANKLKKDNVDILLSYGFIPHTIFAYIVSRLIKKPFIYSQIDLNIEKLINLKLTRYFVLNILKRALAINVPGKYSQIYWRKLVCTKTFILHSTIDVEYYKPSKVNNKYDLIYVGVLEKWKRIDLLLEAVSILKSHYPSIKFAIVGYGSQEDNLKSLSLKLNLDENVEFLGKRNVTPELLCSSKIFVLTSPAEGLPCSLLEAMACELICVSRNVGNISEAIIDSKTGFFFRSSSPAEMSKLLHHILVNYNSLLQIRNNARDMIIKNHSYNTAMGKWDNLLAQVAEHKVGISKNIL